MDALRRRPLTLTERFLRESYSASHAYLLGLATALSLGLGDESAPAMTLTAVAVHSHQNSSCTIRYLRREDEFPSASVLLLNHESP